jgi:hypothetical protein
MSNGENLSVTLTADTSALRNDLGADNVVGVGNPEDAWNPGRFARRRRRGVRPSCDCGEALIGISKILRNWYTLATALITPQG